MTMRTRKRPRSSEEPARQDQCQLCCAYCNVSLEGKTYIECAVCSGNEGRYCTDCFSVSASLYPHSADHQYLVMDLVLHSPVEDDWSAAEEMLLIDALLEYGLGNWEVIADFVGSKGEVQCRLHYEEFYLCSHAFPLLAMKAEAEAAKKPGLSITAPEEGNTQDFNCLMRKSDLPDSVPDRRNENGSFSNAGSLQPGQEAAVVESSARESVEVPQSDIANAAKAGLGTTGDGKKPLRSQLHIMSTQASQKTGTGSERNSSSCRSHEVSGYHPLREEFEVEWDDEAEAYMSTISFEEDDTEEERSLKFRLIAIYQERLCERERVKQHVFERDLLDFESLRTKDRKMLRDEKELRSVLRTFSRLHDEDKHEDLVKAFLYEERLLARIFELAHYRGQGLRTLHEADLYEIDRRKRVSDLQLRKAKEPAYRSTVKSSSRGSRYLNRERQSTSLSPSPIQYKSSPVCTSMSSPFPSVSLDLGQEEMERDIHRKPSPLGRYFKKAAELPLEIATLQGFDSLTPKEKEICSILRITPQKYLCLRIEAMQRGQELVGGSGSTGSTSTHKIVCDLSKPSGEQIV